MARKSSGGPKFVKLFAPLLQALVVLGGSGQPDEVKEEIIKQLGVSDEVLASTTSSGSSRFINQVHWARFYLAAAGYLADSARGVWTISELGRQHAAMNQDEALAIFRDVRSMNNWRGGKSGDVEADEGDAIDIESSPTATGYREQLLAILLSIPPGGFERLCQLLLRESGFERVTVTGKSGDGGIDGIGVLSVSPFVSFRVLFQCKRYQGSVSASQVRDFRGSMLGRADRGIVITTGTFTQGAIDEANRDGAPPIELVDGEKLIRQFERLSLGLKERKTFDVDPAFFEQFMN